MVLKKRWLNGFQIPHRPIQSLIYTYYAMNNIFFFTILRLYEFLC